MPRNKAKLEDDQHIEPLRTEYERRSEKGYTLAKLDVLHYVTLCQLSKTPLDQMMVEIKLNQIQNYIDQLPANAPEERDKWVKKLVDLYVVYEAALDGRPCESPGTMPPSTPTRTIERFTYETPEKTPKRRPHYPRSPAPNPRSSAPKRQ